MPYRSWCFSCVAGRGADDAYRKSDGHTGPPRVECDFMFLSSRVHLVNPGLTIFNMIDRESQSMAAALTVKAAGETLVRFFLAILDAWGRSDVKVLLRSDQEVTLTLILREVQARRQQRTLVERSPVESHATMGAMERANRTMGEMLRTMKHATETRVGGRLETDHPLISWMIRHCCWSFAGIMYELTGELLMKCFGITATERRTRLFRRNRLGSGTRIKAAAWQVRSELAGAGLVGKERKTRKSTYLCCDEHGVRKFRTIRRQPESARWRREYVDKPPGDPFNPKPKTSMAVGREQARTSMLTRHPETAPEPAATQKRWYVTEALVNELGRTMGCPRCSSGIGIHNAECRARIEGILLQQSRINPTRNAPTELTRDRWKQLMSR